jgi:Uma2 family endonuclease
MSVEQVLTQPPAVEGKPLRLRMSYEEYLDWADEDVHAEWVNGEVIVHMPPKKLHQALVGFLDRIIGLFVAVFDLGEVHVAPLEVKLDPDGPSREPDLLFLSKAHLDRHVPERVLGPPDLIVEIVSDDSVHRDRVTKFDEYEAAGVLEYWVIDNRPEQGRAWFYQLDPSGRYRSVLVSDDGVYRSAVLPGFELRVAWLWQEQPDVLSALAELVGPERFAQALRAAVQRDV